MRYVAEKRNPNARLHIFNPCGHLTQLERPGEFNLLVLEFMVGLESCHGDIGTNVGSSCLIDIAHI
jgi:hypothetical protein